MFAIDPRLVQVLASLDVVLEDIQPHLSGERYLMSPDKVVLVGNMAGRRVIIKASNSRAGRQEIEQESAARELLGTLPFSIDRVLIPEQLFWGERGEYLLSITSFIEQDAVFVKRALEEQFFLALRAFEAQEAFHATTYEHIRQVKAAFKTTTPDDYLRVFASWGVSPQAENFLRENREALERYSNYLTHTDFVPHNIRVHNGAVYLLDQVAIAFANKYEGWARLLNYMVLHNLELEKLLRNYVLKNRGKDEYLDLRLMRVFKIGFLINFYTKSLPKTEGDLKELTKARIELWTKVLEAVLEDREISNELIEEYKQLRDSLRSQDEKRRQREFAVA